LNGSLWEFGFKRLFFFFSVLGLELRAYTLNHSTSPVWFLDLIPLECSRVQNVLEGGEMSGREKIRRERSGRGQV
jgi:hypothetical protein